jgi:cyanophycinase
MKKMLILFLSLHIFIFLPAFSEAKGYLFIIGGGSRPETMMKKFVKLADKFNSGKIIIFPMASSIPDEVGPEQAEQLKRFGARQVQYHILTREQALSAENTGILDDIGGVFFSGGVQSRLMNILIDTPIHKKLLEIYEKGAVIGGTSAGAAVMSKVMITGGEKREVEEGHKFETIQANNIVTVRGLGFIKTAIIDQHFVRRKRHNRLISLVAENPRLLGVGIDESTAIIVSPEGIFEVVGERNVIVYDATQAQIRIASSRLFSGFNMVMHILSSGDRYSLKSKQVIR